MGVLPPGWGSLLPSGWLSSALRVNCMLAQAVWDLCRGSLRLHVLSVQCRS